MLRLGLDTGLNIDQWLAKRLALRKYDQLFVSYHHLDHAFRKQFEQQVFAIEIFQSWVNGSVEDGEINPKLSDLYIKQIIRDDHVTNTTILIVLIGAETYCRKHVDWEIAGGLAVKSALMGIVLPTCPRYDDGAPVDDYLPPRLRDNVQSGYARLFIWEALMHRDTHEELINAFNETAVSAKPRNIRNGRKEYKRNRAAQSRLTVNCGRADAHHKR